MSTHTKGADFMGR